ncbi:unnamed protein product [Paramecium pentaurelia]|uniref:Uncharacterized protein n=1 Tax=Paramecium pentaurelia TaxID=43138 RepID=A0A8S1X4X9_9CILI|nr:unnamed protein product [Paramecium pentaurelia]
MNNNCTHVTLLLDLSPSLAKFEMFTSLDFKYEFLIESLTSLIKMLTNQLLSIFIIKEESVITFLRNHPTTNLPLLIELIAEYIRNHYSNQNIYIKKTIQQAIDMTISQLRSYQQPYNNKKYIIFSDFTNFSYGGFLAFDLWDTQGYTFSFNGVLIGSQKLNGYESFKLVIDPQVISDYMENLNGELYDINLRNKNGILIEIDQIVVSINNINKQVYNTRQQVGEYINKYPKEMYEMRKKEGFKEENQQTLSIRVNDQMRLLYQIGEDNVIIYLERNQLMDRPQSPQKKQTEQDNEININCKMLFEMYKERDQLQEIVLDMQLQKISIEEGMGILVKKKAFESQKFINRNFKQISLVYLIRPIDFRQFQEEGEEFNKNQFYHYIRQKLQEVSTKQLQNCLLYQQGQDFVMIRILWHSHTIIRLICIYNDSKMLPILQNRIKEVFKSNQILRNSLIEFDHSLKNLLIKSETHFLKKNPDLYVLERCWEWKKELIWDLQQMYRILTSVRIKSNYWRVPSLNDRTNKFFVAQLELGQKIVIVQNLILQEDRIICNIFTENIISEERNVLIEYFDKIKEFEKQIVITLHTAHSMYRQSLIKKQNSSQVDFFTLQFITRQGKLFQTKEQVSKQFIEYAQSQATYYPTPTNQLDYNSLFQKGYLYYEIKQKQIDEESKNRLNIGYLQVLQQIANHIVLKQQSQINQDLLFIVVGPQRLLMIAFTLENTTFYLISLEQIERNHTSHPFLNANQEKKVDALINFVQQEYNSVFAKEVHQQFMNNIFTSQIQEAIEGCQIEILDVDLNQAQQDVRLLFDQQARKMQKKSSIAEETPSPNKQFRRQNYQQRLNDIKQSFVQKQCQKWDERLQKLMNDHKISMKQIEDSQQWYFYDNKQEKNENILFLSVKFRDGEAEYQSIQQLIENFRLKQKRLKLTISYLIYYYDKRSLIKILNEGLDFLQVSSTDELTSIKRKIQRWSDPFRKYNNEFMKKFQLEIQRLLPMNEDNIKLIYIMIEGMDNKFVEYKQSDKKFDKHFASQFSEEIKNTSELNQLLKYINLSDEYYVFILTTENCNMPQFEEFELEKEFLADEQQVIPFWFIIRVQEQQFSIVWYSEYQFESLKKTAEELRELILETIERTLLYLIIRKATESTNKVKLILSPYFEIDEETPALEQIKQSQNPIPPPTQQKNVHTRNMWKTKTIVETKVQESKEYKIPFVGWKVFHPYQPKKPFIQYLINNTILMNHQIDSNQYYGQLDKQYYLFSFQNVKNISNYAERYPELCSDIIPGQLSIIMNVYSTNKNQKKIIQDIDYYYEHIKRNMDEDTINALSQGVIRNPRLKEQEFYLIQKGEHNHIEILLNNNIKDMLAFSTFMRHNLEKTFCKYEVQQQEKVKFDAQRDDLRYIVDQHENSFIFSKYKVVYSPNVNMSNFFGQGLCLLNFLYQVDGEIITSYQFPKQPKCIQQEDLLYIPASLPPLQFYQGPRTSRSEVCYDISKNYHEKFLIIDVISRGQLEWNAFKEYFAALVRQVELEYQIEIIQLRGKSKDQLQEIQQTFKQLKHYSFKMHHFVYPLYYDEILWNNVMGQLKNKIIVEFDKKGINPQLSQQFEQQFSIQPSVQLDHSSMVYIINDGQDYEQAILLDGVKHFASQKQKKNDPIDLYHRSLLVYVHLSNQTLEVFLYNLNCDIAANLNHQFGILSRWSIIRNLVAQKIKNDLCGCYNVRLSPLYEEIFMTKHNIYEHSIVNDLLRLRSQDQANKKVKKEDQPDQFSTVSKAIETIIMQEFPPQDIQLFDFVKHLEKFFKLNFSVVKPKKLNIDQNQQGDFLQREGKAFLELIKDFYKNYIQTQLIKYVKKMKVSGDVQIAQSKPILEKILNQSKSRLQSNPLYIFRMKEKSELKGSLDLEKEYLYLINQGYKKVLKQSNYEIILGDDIKMDDMDDQIIDDELKKNNQLLNEEDAKSLMSQVDLHLYYNENMLKHMNFNVQSSDFIRRVNYLRKKDNPSIIKMVALLSFKFPFIFEKTYCLPGEELPQEEKGTENFTCQKLEKFHSELIEQEWKKNELQIDLYMLINGYSKIYQKFNHQYPKIDRFLYRISVGFVLDWIKIDGFIKFILSNSRIYYLNKLHGFYVYDNQHIIQKSEQLQVSLYLNLLGSNELLDYTNIIELELDEQQQGSKQLSLVANLLINSPNIQQFLQTFEGSLLETLKRAHKNFMAYEWWNKIKINNQLSAQDLAFLIPYCQQIQTKKLAKEIRFEQLDNSYKLKRLPVEQLLLKLPQICYVVDNQKSILIVNNTQDVLYLIDLINGMIDNIRILYLMMDNPHYDQEKMIKPHYDWCTQLIKQCMDEMI